MEITYRWKFKSLVAYLPIAFFFSIPTVALDLLTNFIFMRTPMKEIPWIFWFEGFVAILFTLVTLFMFAMFIFQGLFGGIKISPDALEYQRWPFLKHRFDWKKVESIYQGTLDVQTPLTRGWLDYGSLLVLKDKKGWEIKIRSGTLGSGKYHIIPIGLLPEKWTQKMS